MDVIASPPNVRGYLWPVAPDQSAHAQGRLTRYERYRQVYRGDQWTTQPKPGERQLVMNYCRVFVNKAASYLMGKPVSYGVDVQGGANGQSRKALNKAAATFEGWL